MELQTEYHLQSIERLVTDLERVGDSKERLALWLGYPVLEMAGEDYEVLTAYVAEAEEAIRDKRPTPLLPRRHPPRKT